MLQVGKLDQCIHTYFFLIWVVHPQTLPKQINGSKLAGGGSRCQRAKLVELKIADFGQKMYKYTRNRLNLTH
jgi:hypothetical protein